MENNVSIIQQKKAALGTMERFLGNHDMANYNADPNKETVLTPMGVVNLHISSMLGGWRYCDKDGNYSAADKERTGSYDAGTMLRLGMEVKPEYFDTPEGIDFSDPDATYLEVNSKTSHYPLHLIQNIFDHRKHEITNSDGSIDIEDRFNLWKDIVERQIFAIYQVPLSGVTTKNRLSSIFHPEAAANWGIDTNNKSQTIVPNVVKADIANISKHLRSIIKGDIDGISAEMLFEKIWRFIFDKEDFARAEKRAQQVLETNNATEVKKLVNHVDAGDGVAAAFDVVVGNPPYQEGEAGKVNDAVYHHFMNAAKKISSNVSLIYPARWLTGGRGAGMDDFRNKELSSKNYVKFVLDPRNDFFDNVETKGGVNYFLWSKNESSSVDYIHGDDSVEKRGTLLNGRSVFIRETRFSKISEKLNVNEHLKPTGLWHYGAHITRWDNLKSFMAQATEETVNVSLYYSEKGGGVVKSVIPKDVSAKDTGGYKVFVSETADPKGNSLRRPGRVFVGELDEICTGSFVAFNHLKSIEESKRLLKYLKTDLSTFLIGIITVTQHTGAKAYKLIPDIDPATGEIKDKPGVFLDFSGNSDDLDDQLAEIYELTDEERELMKSSIKPWKDKNSLTADGLY